MHFYIEDTLTLIPAFAKDAQECYSFRQQFMWVLSTTWNPFLFCIIVLSIILLINVIFTTKWKLVGIINSALHLLTYSVLYLLPLMCIAYANDAVGGLLNAIVKSGLNDYAIIGGRSDWADYVKNVPAYWCVMNIPITCK